MARNVPEIYDTFWLVWYIIPIFCGPYQPVAKVVTAFDRPCTGADCVALRSHMVQYAPSERLVRRAQERSRCSRDFHHGLLRVSLNACELSRPRIIQFSCICRCRRVSGVIVLFVVRPDQFPQYSPVRPNLKIQVPHDLIIGVQIEAVEPTRPLSQVNINAQFRTPQGPFRLNPSFLCGVKVRTFQIRWIPAAKRLNEPVQSLVGGRLPFPIQPSIFQRPKPVHLCLDSQVPFPAPFFRDNG